jgi:hypothetical protein
MRRLRAERNLLVNYWSSTYTFAIFPVPCLTAHLVMTDKVKTGQDSRVNWAPGLHISSYTSSNSWRRFVKRILPFLCLLALCNLTLFAQTREGLRAVHTTEKSAIHAPAQEKPAGLRAIYTNLGSKGDLYLDTDGWSLTGFNSYGGDSYAFEIGLPFTPKSDSHVAQVRVAVQYIGPGANQINLSIYGDSNGAPGAVLAGPVTVTNLPAYGTCCTLTIGNFTPLAVTGGTRYWVVANTPATGTGSDFVGVWDWVSKIILFGGSNGVDGWSGINIDGLPAGEVMGTIP